MQSVHEYEPMCVPLLAYTATQWSFHKAHKDAAWLVKYIIYICCIHTYITLQQAFDELQD